MFQAQGCLANICHLIKWVHHVCILVIWPAKLLTVTKQIGLEDDELFVTTLTTKNHYLVVHPTYCSIRYILGYK